MKNVVKNIRLMKYFYLLILFVFSIFPAHSKQILLEVDGAVFKLDSNQVVWEMYYSFPDTALKYNYIDGKFLGELYLSITFQDSEGKNENVKWIIEHYNDNPGNNFKMNLLGKKSFILNNGLYKVNLFITDLNDTANYANANFEINARKFSDRYLGISDIELAQVIEHKSDTSNWNDIFYKNTLFVIPNPSLIVAGDRPTINSYLEIYNAKDVSPDGFLLHYRIFDGLKREVLFYPRKRRSDGNGLVETISLPVDALASGVYYLQIAAVYPAREPKDSAVVFKKLYILNPEMPPQLTSNYTELLTFENSEFKTLSDEQAEIEFQKAKYIASSYEIDIFSNCVTTEAKQRFLYTFWKKRNPDSTSAYNTALADYKALIEHANRFYSYGLMKDGWRTDRGRVLLKYGKPTQIDYFARDGELRPYEIWFYAEIQGGIHFYFVDKTDYGNYILVNSTAIGEVRNDNWYDENVIPLNFDAFQNKINNR